MGKPLCDVLWNNRTLFVFDKISMILGLRTGLAGVVRQGSDAGYAILRAEPSIAGHL